MRFSIIIPVYNVEKYIRKCMETVMGQTFRDYEVIVVDDESPDNSMKIVEEFADKYPGQIKTIHQKNTRQGGARNRGVQEAVGEYLIFVDSDDYVSLNMLEKIDHYLKENPCDILSFQYMMVTPEGKRLGEAGLGSLRSGKYFPEKDRKIMRLPVGPVNKAYCRKFYLDSGFQFPQKILYEDAMARVLFAKAKSIVLCEECLYFYVQSCNSSIRQKPSRQMLDILTVTDMVLDAFKKDNLYGAFKEELDASLLVGILYIFNIINKADRNNLLQDKFAEYLQNRFSQYESNPCISRENKAAIQCILSRNYTRYYFRFLRKLEMTEKIMGYAVISKLNQLRKRIMQGKKAEK